MNLDPKAPAFRCHSCRRAWSLLRVGGLLRCAACSYQNTRDEAGRAAREEAARRAAIFG